MLSAYKNVPTVELKASWTGNDKVRVLVRREDLNHETISGNKWWKLKYNLEHAAKLKAKTILTFGGAYSNMIYATAAAANAMGFNSIGVIRGEESFPINHTLAFAKKMGMHLHFVSREDYRKKSNEDFIDSLKEQLGDFYMLPEGGTNELAVTGCIELGKKIIAETEFDYVCLPIGTGGTAAGVIAGLAGLKEVIGFSSLKGGDFLEEEIKQLFEKNQLADPGNWSIQTRFHFGGYGKSTEELNSFIRQQQSENELPLDPVYTSKMMYGIAQLIREGYFKSGSTVLAIHTGGLQKVS
ncbi:MAG TPA: pyridoxal-phosphate dependent enzyme [Cyclobacteriaceae bacterium]|nr:pyridoxal-phosphate dependent enzyme [Cyclobacteriaceae bacterium]